MIRVLALLMICVVTFSHGTMSLGAPHGFSAASHTHDHDAIETQSVEDHEQTADRAAPGNFTQPSDGGVVDADVAHVHPAADEARLANAFGVRLMLREARDFPVHDSPLAPTSTAPLLEPPSA